MWQRRTIALALQHVLSLYLRNRSSKAGRWFLRPSTRGASRATAGSFALRWVTNNSKRLHATPENMRLSFRRTRNKGSTRDVDDDAGIAQELEAILREKEETVAVLRKEVQKLTSDLQTNSHGIVKRSHPLEPVIHVVDDKGTKGTSMGRHASYATATVLNQMGPGKKRDELARKMVAMFKHPEKYTDYLQSDKFARDIIKLCKRVAPIFESESRCIFVQSPMYVFGDIHGNLEDLNFFGDNMWKLGINLTAGKFLFLGDYVDRGMQGLECLAYLFSLKVENPAKIYMLRGNHELRDVNGWVEHYGEKSFLWQCQARFGMDMGEMVWEECNAVFDRLPLAAVIDHDIFCVHGGIPRPLPGSVSRIQDIMSIPAIAGVCPPNEFETFESQQAASDCLWSDPAKEDQELTLDKKSGFGESLRGGGAICFGEKAIDDFLKQGNLSYIVRAHEAHADGVALSKGAKVFTVFSTSKDHGQGKGAMCGCILVDFDKIQVINRSAKYKNKYVHRRDSVSLINLSRCEVEARTELGLITDADFQSDGGSSDDENFEGYVDHSLVEDHYSSDDEVKVSSAATPSKSRRK